MKKLFLISVVLSITFLACGQHPNLKRLKQPPETKQKADQEVIIVLSPYIDNYDYDILKGIEVRMEYSSHPWLTRTEDILVKLIKKAQQDGANAITNLDIGSFDIYGHLESDGFLGYQHVIYAKATPLVINNFEGLPAPKVIVKDRSYIRVQSTNYPIEQNAIIVLSPFVKRIKHELVGEVEINLDNLQPFCVTQTEDIIRTLFYDAISRGANAISGLDIGSYSIVKHFHREDDVGRQHTVYGKALAVKILPKKTKK